MTSDSATPPTARQQLARVLRFARTSNIWQRNGNTWRDGGTFQVDWWPDNASILVRRTSHRTAERLTSEVEVDSIREALDVLVALNALPQGFAPAYAEGVADGTVSTQRTERDHYQASYADMVHTLTADIVALGAFVDDRHQYRNPDDCDATPGADCASWCTARKALDGLDGEQIAMIRAERAV